MRWPWRRRARGGRVVFIGTSPFDVVAAVTAIPTPSPVVAAWIPDEPPVTTAPPAAPAPAAPPAPAPAAAAPPATADNAAGPAGAPAVAPLAAAAAPLVAAPVPAPVAAVPAPRHVGVQLGFADGSVMTLDDDDPRAVALRKAAARLTGTS